MTGGPVLICCFSFSISLLKYKQIWNIGRIFADLAITTWLGSAFQIDEERFEKKLQSLIPLSWPQVDDDASHQAIKIAYRSLAKECHPDYLGIEGHNICILLNEVCSYTKHLL